MAVKLNNFVRFEVLMAASMKMRAFWDIALCSLGLDQRLRGKPDDGGSIHL
jgi:hypothetical protein